MKLKIYPRQNILRITVLFFMVFFLSSEGYSQIIKRNRPVWWFGESIAGNFNFYRGTTQQLNESVTVPTSFTNGKGLRLYFSFLAEYRKNKVWGGMLNLAFNNRSSSFDGVITPSNSKAFLYTVLRYVNIEPSIRIAPFSSGLYFFAGPTLSINSTKEFFYLQEGQHEMRGDWSNLRKYVLGAQGGTGMDIPISKKQSANQLTLSPFVSYQTNLLDGPRKGESWSIYTFRAGLAVKFGTRKIPPLTNTITVQEWQSQNRTDTLRMWVKDVHFSIQPPTFRPTTSELTEIFPLINAVFFNSGSTDIPNRFIQLTPSEAIAFRETNLEKTRPINWYNHRSERQLTIYYNILNIIGDRLRNNLNSTISLVTATETTLHKDGKALKESIKHYLVTVFGINEARILTDVGSAGFIESVQQQGNLKDMILRKEEDRRVDIISSFPDILAAVGRSNVTIKKESSAKAKAENEISNSVTFNVDGANELLSEWSVSIKNDQGYINEFGPYTKEKETILVSNILGNSDRGDFYITMTGKTKTGQSISKEGTLTLQREETMPMPRMRYSVLFNFDRSKSITANEHFLADLVSPLVTDSSTVIIQGHTDIVGGERYNQLLSTSRVTDVRQIIERVLLANGKKGVKFEYYGFGTDFIMSPFQNNLPETRFYNRTVMIDIIQGR